MDGGSAGTAAGLAAALVGSGEASVGARRAPRAGARERLFDQGAAALTDSELLSLLLGTGTRGNPVQVLAANLIEAGGGLKALLTLEPQDLCALPGLGRARASLMVAALELGRRAQQARDRRPRLRTAAEIFRYLQPTFCVRRTESFRVLCFNPRNVLLQDVQVAEGTQDTCPVDPREVFRPAVTCRASAVVLAHNHPSGDPEPSVADLALTRQLVQGGLILGVKVLDHVVVGDGAFVSMRERGQVEELFRGNGTWRVNGGG